MDDGNHSLGSEHDPDAAAPFALRVDYLPPSALALPGRLGLTRAPGRWCAGRGADSDAWLREDLATLAGTYRARALVTLLEQQEIARLGDLGREARRAGLAWIHFPIPDMWVPEDVGATRRLVARILRALERDENVVVHCWGGLGRSGTIAASCLVARGVPPPEAIALVRGAREGAVESAVQQRFVEEFAGGGAAPP